MQLKQILVCLISALLFNSCFNNSLKHEIHYEFVRELVLPDSTNSLYLIENQSYNINDSSSIYIFQQFENKKIYSINVKENGIYFKETSIKTDHFFFSMFLQTMDSIYSFDNNTNELILSNGYGNQLNKYIIDDSFTPIVSLSTRLIGSSTNLLLGNASKNIDFGSLSGRLNYYRSVNPVLSISLFRDTLLCKGIGRFPDEYVKTGHNYYDVAPSVCITDNGFICLSFGADDHLYLYKDTTLVLSKNVKSNYISDYSAIPDDKRFDMLYLKKYISEEPRYLNIKYDPFNKLFYRIVKHRLLNGLNSVDRFWSVIILNNDLNVIGETKFTYEFETGVFLPTPYGIMLLRNNNSEKENSAFVLIKLEIDEK
jgi:hypothetical protein